MVQSFLSQLQKAGSGVSGKEQLHHFLEQSRRRNVRKQGGKLLDRSTGLGFYFQAQFCRKAYRAQHAHRIFAIALIRVSDHAQAARFQIGKPATEIEDLLGSRIVEQGVYRKVPACGILFLSAKYVIAYDPSMLVRSLILLFVALACTEG